MGQIKQLTKLCIIQYNREVVLKPIQSCSTGYEKYKPSHHNDLKAPLAPILAEPAVVWCGGKSRDIYSGGLGGCGNVFFGG